MNIVVNPDITEERENCKLDLKVLSDSFWNGEKINDRRKYIEKLVEEDDEYRSLPKYDFLSKPDKYSYAVRKAFIYRRLIEKLRACDFQESDYFYLLMTIYPNEAGPLNLHITMFLPMLRYQCDERQAKKWIRLAERFEIIGTYVQTEMGHGTHLRGIETTATFDPASDEFIIHSPTLTSTKWWPGGLGKTSTHAAVMADLVIFGQHYGMHGFIVQLRSLADHRPMDGVKIGTIGPKFGYDSIDNGFVRFDHVRVPRDQMLAKYCTVSREGVYQQKGNKKMLYLTMLQTRIGIAIDSAMQMAMAATIVTRYSVVRRQCEISSGKGEVKILEHLAQRKRVLPHIAESYALRYAGLNLKAFYAEVEDNLFNKSDDSQLSELHALTSCLKAYSTFRFAEVTETCRLACGGHGYSQASGLPKLYVHGVPGATYEGDNNVLYLQCAKILLKNLMTSHKTGTKICSSMRYLTEDLPSLPKQSPLSTQDIVVVFKQRARKSVYRLLHAFLSAKSSGCSNNEALDVTSLLQIQAARCHAHQYICSSMVDKVKAMTSAHSLQEGGDGAAANSKAMGHLAHLYLNESLISEAGDLLKYSIITADQLAECEDGHVSLLSLVRPQAVSLVDAFDFTDDKLCSVLGRYDGNVYPEMFAWAQNDPLNKTQVHSSYKDLKKVLTYVNNPKL